MMNGTILSNSILYTWVVSTSIEAGRVVSEKIDVAKVESSTFAELIGQFAAPVSITVGIVLTIERLNNIRLSKKREKREQAEEKRKQELHEKAMNEN